MAVESGSHGSILIGSSAIAEGTKWTFDGKADEHTWGKFGGQGYKDSMTGYKSATGTMVGKYDATDPIDDVVDVGDEVALYLYIYETSKYIYIASARITGISFNVDGDTGAPVEWTVSFSVNGPWLYHSTS